MKQVARTIWQHTLQHSKKLEFYNTFKTEYAPSYYLDFTRKFANRKALRLVFTGDGIGVGVVVGVVSASDK